MLYYNVMIVWHRLEGDSLAPPCQSEDDVIESIMNVITDYYRDLNNSNADTKLDLSRYKLIDLGCGDGRICIEATKRFSCTSYGCEIEESLINAMIKNISQVDVNLRHKIHVLHEDLREISLDEYNIILIYLLPEAIAEIKPKLMEALKREDCIIICNSWGIKGEDIAALKTTYCGYSNNTTLRLYNHTSISQ